MPTSLAITSTSTIVATPAIRNARYVIAARGKLQLENLALEARLASWYAKPAHPFGMSGTFDGNRYLPDIGQ